MGLTQLLLTKSLPSLVTLLHSDQGIRGERSTSFVKATADPGTWLTDHCLFRPRPPSEKEELSLKFQRGAGTSRLLPFYLGSWDVLSCALSLPGCKSKGGLLQSPPLLLPRTLQQSFVDMSMKYKCT